MTTYILSYDLKKEMDTKDYARLTKSLKDHEFVRLQGSVWSGRHTGDAKAVHDYFKMFMDENDSLIVTELSTNRCMSEVKKR